MDIRVKINNEYVIFPDQPPINLDNRILVPVRHVFEKMGYKVKWTPGKGVNPKGAVTISNRIYEIIIYEDKTTFSINGKTYTHTDGISARLIGSRIMVPVRAILERLGCTVEWIDNNTVDIKEEQLYTIEDITTNSSSPWVIGGKVNWKVIRTKVKYIHPRIINQPIINTNYIGINGGFFSAADYTISPCESPNDGGRSISWNKDASDNYLYNGKKDQHVARGTIVIIRNGDMFDARVIQISKASEASEYLPNADIIAMIGGGDLALWATDDFWYENVYKGEDWENTILWGVDTANIPNGFHGGVRRAGIGINEEQGEKIAYLAVSKGGAVLADLRTLFADELRCDYGIFLDGSGSSQYRYVDESGEVVVDGGTDTPSRHIWNMIEIAD